MRHTVKLAVALASFAATLAAVGVVAPVEAQPTTTSEASQADPTITISNEGGSYLYSPAQLDAQPGQAITVTNTDARGVHSVTADDGSFSVDVPPQSSVTLTVSEPGTYAYYCQYHPETHNEASITVS